MAESDWDTVTVLRKKGPTAAQAKSKQVLSQRGAAGSCRAARRSAVAGPSRGIRQWVGTRTDLSRVETLGDNRYSLEMEYGKRLG
jgi:putative transcription factor